MTDIDTMDKLNLAFTTASGCSTRPTAASSRACCHSGAAAVALPTSTCSRQQCSMAPGGACCCSDLQGGRMAFFGHRAAELELHCLGWEATTCCGDRYCPGAFLHGPTVGVLARAWSLGGRRQAHLHCRLRHLRRVCDATWSCTPTARRQQKRVPGKQLISQRNKGPRLRCQS